MINRTFEKVKDSSPVTIVWKEEVTQFDHAEFRITTYIQAIKRFHETVRGTTGNFRANLRMSENLTDFWKFGYLGAAVEGKVCANAYWYIRFIREDGQWRVWCLEEIAR